MEEDLKKENYELWWEYLKRSKGYKKWLESDAPEEYLKWSDKCRTASRKDFPLTIPAKIAAEQKWSSIFLIWGDVHNSHFEDWWEKRENKRSTEEFVVDYSDRWAAFDINHCFLNMKNKPTDITEFKEEFKDDFIKRMKNSSALHLVVDCNEDIETLKKELARLVTKKKKEKKRTLDMFRSHKLLCGQVRRENLEQYLKVYDLRNAKTPELDIAKEVYTYKNGGFEGKRQNKEKTGKSGKGPKERGDELRNFYKFAERIINNVERGIFPGNYRKI